VLRQPGTTGVLLIAVGSVSAYGATDPIPNPVDGLRITGLPSRIGSASPAVPTPGTCRGRHQDIRRPPGRGQGVSEDVFHDAAVAVVVPFAWGVQPDPHGEADRVGVHGERVRGDAVVELRKAGDGEGLGAGEAQARRGLPVQELQREHAHSDQVRAVDPFERFGQNCPDAQQGGAFRGPVA
jgi:hypothetical protein